MLGVNRRAEVRRRVVLLGMLGLVGLFASVSGGAVSAVGLQPGALSNSDASVLSVSCAAAGDCVAGGYYVDGLSYRRQAFVVGETNGSWGKAIEVPGTAALNRGGEAGWTRSRVPRLANASPAAYYTDRGRE